MLFSLSACKKSNIFKTDHFILDGEKYKIDDYSAVYFGPTLTRYIFESGGNTIDLELSYCNENELNCMEYIYDDNDYDFRLIFYKENGAIKKCKRGTMNISEKKSGKYDMEIETSMSGNIELTGFFRDTYTATNQENTFNYQNKYYPIDTVLVYQYSSYFEVYILQDFDDYNSAGLGFIMWAYSEDELNGVLKDLYYDFAGIVFFDQNDVREVNGGKIKTTFVEQKTDEIAVYDFYESIYFGNNEKIVGDYVGPIQIEYLEKSNSDRIQKIRKELYKTVSKRKYK